MSELSAGNCSVGIWAWKAWVWSAVTVLRMDWQDCSCALCALHLQDLCVRVTLTRLRTGNTVSSWCQDICKISPSPFLHCAYLLLAAVEGTESRSMGKQFLLSQLGAGLPEWGASPFGTVESSYLGCVSWGGVPVRVQNRAVLDTCHARVCSLLAFCAKYSLFMQSNLSLALPLLKFIFSLLCSPTLGLCLCRSAPEGSL